MRAVLLAIAEPDLSLLGDITALGAEPVASYEAVLCRPSYPLTDKELIGNIAVYEAIVQSSDSGETVRLG
ncbi:MAG: hypothetical protein JJU15_14365 [Pararhodobacter sp.]|nr:hypothetical protein [Pararhodobacter sp.]